jgi:hypothetical protein
MTSTRLLIVCLLLFSGLIATGSASAQTANTGTIAGVVKDASGAIMPGVMVEAASPALIEKIRTAVADARGQYRIVDLRPGTYSVTFTLEGFATFRRQGIELTSGFTANVDAEMRVGDLSETVTVSGQAPLVDVQNTQVQTVITRELLDSLPTNRTLQGYAAMTLGMAAGSAGLGVVHDVGGNKGESPVRLTMHGGRADDGRYWLDGMTTNNNDGPSRSFFINQAAAEEVNLTAGGGSAEVQTGGVHVNIIPRSGGNVFSGYFSGNFTDEHFQGQNLTDDLRARGVTISPEIRAVFDFGGGLGGPLKQNKLWFYTSHRYWGTGESVPGNYFNVPALRGTLFYQADLTRPAYFYQRNRDDNVRLTLQATQKQRFAFFYANQLGSRDYTRVELNRAPEATDDQVYPPTLGQASWSYPASNKLLFEAGGQLMYKSVARTTPRDDGPVLGTSISVTELTTGYIYGNDDDRPWSDCKTMAALGTPFKCATPLMPSGRASMSYVTGSHSFKVGFQWLDYINRASSTRNTDPPVNYAFRNGLPNRITYYVSPDKSETWNRVFGYYAQDQWTLRRVTINYGVRIDTNNYGYPAQTKPATIYTPAIDIAAVTGAPNWKDIAPRIGGSWDVFGDGKTAVKAYLGKFVLGGTANVALSPSGSLVTSATRSWTDKNGDFLPQASELGPFSAPLGSTKAVTAVDPALNNGWGVRPYNWESTVSVQHELRPGLSFDATYAHRWFGNFLVTDNLAVSPADYDPYCVTVPTDSRLESASGTQACGLYDLKPAKFGQVNNLITEASNFGKRTEHFDGVDLGLNARLPGGGSVGGGFSTGLTTTDNCQVHPDSPDQRYCHNKIPFAAQTQYKATFLRPLPWWGLEASLVFQNLAGAPIDQFAAVTRSYSNAEISPSLGRNLSSCAATGTCTASVTVTIAEPNTIREKRLNQIDLRISKSLTIAGARLQLRADGYNVLNNSVVLLQNAAYGTTFRQVTGFVAARMIKFSTQFDF